MSYESPINVIYGKITQSVEDNIVNAVQSYGIEVDKDELMRALQYDRDQYEKGYKDGKAEAMQNAEQKYGKWEWESAVAHNLGHRCSVCKQMAAYVVTGTDLVDNYYCGKAEPTTVYTHEELLSNYCPNCGAKMENV